MQTTILNLSIDLILKSYLECALWVSELDEYTIEDISKESIEMSKADIIHFMNLVSKDYKTVEEELFNCDEEYIGHNLFLSRNGHGAGFFDEYRDRLQQYAKSLKPIEIWVGGDQIIYFNIC